MKKEALQEIREHLKESQSLLIQGRFQQNERKNQRNRQLFGTVAIPFDPGQVSTLTLCKSYKILFVNIKTN